MRDQESIQLDLLLLRCRRGRRDALEQLVRRFERQLFYYIRRIVQDEATAWDALQKTWIRIFAGLPKLGDDTALKPWLYCVARNTALNHNRDERRQRGYQIEHPEQLDPADESAEFCDEDAEEIHHALDQLNLPDRESLTLYFLEAMPVSEIAQVLEIPVGTVKSRLSVARKRLRQILEKRNG